ncbi:DUF4476 domain-containing protein [Fulvivirga ligni]|uniref:DUF4476 domain-containing protein n=1 Tax=Fulvivirga ligni TaxID=2904246 RepID=UPI001F189803|nr:DUF4476 domain-containing protein [Fulvivirga ligni]UII22536.1 DUF4476 domain-containing protein [Fulvivirga ligni]
MKKATLLLIFAVLAMSSSMAAEKAAATFRTAKGEKIQVIINNKVINHQPKKIVKVQGGGGLLDVKIKVYKPNKTITFRDHLDITPGFKSDFTVVKLGSKNAAIEKTGITRMYNNHYRRPESIYNRRYYSIVSESDMNTLMNRMNRAYTDQSRLLVARNGIGDKKITTYDVNEILASLEYEDSKLKFAKWAYKRTLDQKQYEDIYGAFQYRTSIMELDRFIYG